MNVFGIVAAVGAACFLEYNSRKIIAAPSITEVDQLPNGLNAMCVPPFGIFICRDHSDNAALIEHELIHWEQFQRMGLIPFYFQYCYEMLHQGYDLSEMEQEARYLECEYCRVNYTECVRDGLATTVYNPQFRAGTISDQVRAADLPAGGSIVPDHYAYTY